MAKLHFKYATMNSGKTIDLIRTAYNYEENNAKVLILKPKIDTKGDNKISSRIGVCMSNCSAIHLAMQLP